MKLNNFKTMLSYLILRLLLADFTDKKIGPKIRQDYRDYIFGKAQQDIDHIIKGKSLIDWTN